MRLKDEKQEARPDIGIAGDRGIGDVFILLLGVTGGDLKGWDGDGGEAEALALWG